VRVRVHAVGCGFPDSLIIAGKYQVKAPLPFTPGTEIAGVATEVAPDVSHVRSGARVIALVSQGGMAEECVVPAASLIAIPDAMSMVQGAAFLVNYGTTYHALVQRANLRSGETLLVLGAAGGTGLAAVEIGKALGARVLAAAGSDEKQALAMKHGADAGFNYRSTTIKDAVAQFTEGRGIDVAYDPVGSSLAEQCVRSMAWNGRYLVIGFAGGDIPSIPLNLPLLKGCSIVGVFWGTHTRREPQVHAENVRALMQLFGAGKLRPEITELDGLESIGEALEMIHERRALGKVVLRVSDEAR
jgi:NADPH2:quinone reductase